MVSRLVGDLVDGVNKRVRVQALSLSAAFDNDGFFFDDGFQSFDQEADSGDIDQSFDVSGTGDNANQTVNVSGAANTGNVQDGFGFTQIDSEIDEFEIDGGGSSLEVGGDSDVSSNQEVNQAASSGGRR